MKFYVLVLNSTNSLFIAIAAVKSMMETAAKENWDLKELEDVLQSKSVQFIQF